MHPLYVNGCLLYDSRIVFSGSTGYHLNEYFYFIITGFPPAAQIHASGQSSPAPQISLHARFHPCARTCAGAGSSSAAD